MISTNNPVSNLFDNSLLEHTEYQNLNKLDFYKKKLTDYSNSYPLKFSKKTAPLKDPSTNNDFTPNNQHNHTARITTNPKSAANNTKDLKSINPKNHKNSIPLINDRFNIDIPIKRRAKRNMVGPYQIKAKLGSGSMGSVRVGFDTRYNRHVAIKIIPRQDLKRIMVLPNLNNASAEILNSVPNNPNLDCFETDKFELPSGNPEQLSPENINFLNLLLKESEPFSAPEKQPRSLYTTKERESADNNDLRVFREASITQLLFHPNICRLYDVLYDNSYIFLISELIVGNQLLDYIVKKGRLSEHEAKRIAIQIISALSYCHSNSIVHRDLKIENVLISKSGEIKIIDFGLANLYSPYENLDTFCGSLYFAAPELLSARPYIGPEVDIWSFGVILFVLVCGRVPFDDPSMPMLHKKIKSGKFLMPNFISRQCSDLISKLLIVDPKKRATMDEIFNHEWIKSGLSSFKLPTIPKRIPLVHPTQVDKRIIKVMSQYSSLGFGSAELIEKTILHKISSPAYRDYYLNKFKPFITSMVNKNNNSVLEYINHGDSISELYDFLSVNEKPPLEFNNFDSSLNLSLNLTPLSIETNNNPAENRYNSKTADNQKLENIYSSNPMNHSLIAPINFPTNEVKVPTQRDGATAEYKLLSSDFPFELSDPVLSIYYLVKEKLQRIVIYMAKKYPRVLENKSNELPPPSRHTVYLDGTSENQIIDLTLEDPKSRGLVSSLVLEHKVDTDSTSHKENNQISEKYSFDFTIPEFNFSKETENNQNTLLQVSDPSKGGNRVSTDQKALFATMKTRNKSSKNLNSLDSEAILKENNPKSLNKKNSVIRGNSFEHSPSGFESRKLTLKPSDTSPKILPLEIDNLGNENLNIKTRLSNVISFDNMPKTEAHPDQRKFNIHFRPNNLGSKSTNQTLTQIYAKGSNQNNKTKSVNEPSITEKYKKKLTIKPNNSMKVLEKKSSSSTAPVLSNKGIFKKIIFGTKLFNHEATQSKYETKNKPILRKNINYTNSTSLKMASDDGTASTTDKYSYEEELGYSNTAGTKQGSENQQKGEKKPGYKDKLYLRLSRSVAFFNAKNEQKDIKDKSYNIETLMTSISTFPEPIQTSSENMQFCSSRKLVPMKKNSSLTLKTFKHSSETRTEVLNLLSKYKIKHIEGPGYFYCLLTSPTKNDLNQRVSAITFFNPEFPAIPVVEPSISKSFKTDDSSEHQHSISELQDANLLNRFSTAIFNESLSKTMSTNFSDTLKNFTASADIRPRDYNETFSSKALGNDLQGAVSFFIYNAKTVIPGLRGVQFKKIYGEESAYNSISKALIRELGGK
ncbi:hypothetical protein BB560_004211 [Smittium megazygosporum]|uniref:Non-specific serine/threonine protein kinase n=1 Tax=Smittium megazygosporum TaxID=133381 RepID=A0A2T9Z9Y1_9FUNG|nr:hypothetical protein BB560_004211 [Smittium megazygosporum]